jgi:hypothetical protein
MLSRRECARVRLVFFMMAALLSCSVAWAKKPPKPPPEPPPPGTVFFAQCFNAGEPTYYLEGWAMYADGTGKDRVLPPELFDDVVNEWDGVTPTELVYGQDPFLDRWWLGTKNLGLDPVTGLNIYELFALRPVAQGDGTLGVIEVQVTDCFPAVSGIGLGSGHRPEWSNDGLDSFVSFKGGEIDWSGEEPALVAGHLYRLHVSGLEIEAAAAAGEDLLIAPDDPRLESVVSIANGYEGNHTEHHWDPSGNRVVHVQTNPNPDVGDETSHEDVYLTELHADGTKTTSLLWNSMGSHGVWNVRWSPDGTRIAITDYGHLWTVNPDDPSDVTLVVEGNRYNRVCKDAYWSTDSSELVYCEERFLNKKGGTFAYGMFRVPADGGEPIELGADLDADIPKRVLGWVPFPDLP